MAEEFRKVKEKLSSFGTQKAQTKQATVFVSTSFSPWQESALNALAALSLEANDKIPQNFSSLLRDKLKSNGWNKQTLQQAMAFANHQVKVEYPVHGNLIFELKAPFDETELLTQFKEFFCSALDITELRVERFELEDGVTTSKLHVLPSPGKPAIVFGSACC